jgi:hypothetical protein
MPVRNIDIANVFDEIADFLEIEGENPFRIRAYRNAAVTVRGLGAELKDMVAESADFTELPGIGKELAAKIHEILETGTAKALIKLQERIPKTVLEILRLPNLGPIWISCRRLPGKDTFALLRVSEKKPKMQFWKPSRRRPKKKNALRLPRPNIMPIA